MSAPETAPRGIYWLASYPKSGNTWFRALINNLLADGPAPVSINALDHGSISSARSWLDGLLGYASANLSADEIDRLRPALYRWSLRRPGIVHHKTHEAWTRTVDGEPLLCREATLGAVYLLRNPLDVAVSAAAHWRCSVDAAIERMGAHDAALSNTRTSLRPHVRQRLLSWSQHVRSWTDTPDLNCLVLRYEDLLADTAAQFGRAAAHLGLPSDPARIGRAVQHSRFEELARQEREQGFSERPPDAQRFFRAGRRGGWREQLTPAQVARVVDEHGALMQRHGYVDCSGMPCD